MRRAHITIEWRKFQLFVAMLVYGTAEARATPESRIQPIQRIGKQRRLQKLKIFHSDRQVDAAYTTEINLFLAP